MISSQHKPNIQFGRPQSQGKITQPSFTIPYGSTRPPEPMNPQNSHRPPDSIKGFVSFKEYTHKDEQKPIQNHTIFTPQTHRNTSSSLTYSTQLTKPPV